MNCQKVGNCSICGDAEFCAEERAGETFVRVSWAFLGFILGVIVTAAIAFGSV